MRPFTAGFARRLLCAHKAGAAPIALSPVPIP
jgi:hypothetical protein